MSDRAVYVVIEEGVARIAMDRHVGDLAASELEEGPGCLERAAAQPSEGRFLAPHNYLGGWLVDRETKRVLHFGGGATSSRMRAAWPGHEVEAVEGSEAFEAHVRMRGVPIEPADAWPTPAEDASPALDALRAAEAAAPRPKPPGWPTTSFLMTAVGLALVLRLFTKRWRRRFRAARGAARPGPVDAEALRSLDEAIARAPMPERLEERAVLLARGGRLLEAEADLSRALEAGTTARLLLHRARVRSRLRLPGLAFADEEGAFALDPSLRPGLAARLRHLFSQWRALFGEILGAEDL